MKPFSQSIPGLITPSVFSGSQERITLSSSSGPFFRFFQVCSIFFWYHHLLILSSLANPAPPLPPTPVMIQSFSKPRPLCFRVARAKVTRRSWERGSIFFVPRFRHDVIIIACVAWRFCREHHWGAKPQTPRGFSALARLYYLGGPAKYCQNRYATQANVITTFLFIFVYFVTMVPPLPNSSSAL